MTLIGPILDDRSYEQLRDELIRQIPVFTPEWTNHNESDPGIALLDLFAFLGESLLFRFNQIPEATRLAFLDLLGLQRRPAAAATVLVAVGTERAAGIALPPGTELKAGAVSFETGREVYAWPLTALAAGKFEAAGVDDGPAGPGGEVDPRARLEVERRRDAARRLGLDPTSVQFYETSWLPGDPSLAQSGRPTWLPPDPVAEGTTLDVAGTVDQAFWIALVRRDTTDLAGLQGRTLFVGVALDERVDPPFTIAGCGPAPSPASPGAVAQNVERFRATGLDADVPGMVWRLWTGPEQGFIPLQVLTDSTRGLTGTGVVQLELPARLSPPPIGTGIGDSPPPVEDPELAAAVVAWVQVLRPRGDQRVIPRLRWVGVNAVEATQARTATAELLGVGTGEAGQRYRLAHPGVRRRTVALDVEEATGWKAWTEVDSFTGDRPNDQHFVVDLTAGEVQFGTRGRVPQIGRRIRVRSYQYGGGVAGNVAAGAITSAPQFPAVSIGNPLRAAGGIDAESIPEALERIPEEVQRHDRAVTAEDFSALARQFPEVARAETLAQFFPQVPNRPAAGVVSVMIFPERDVTTPETPTPDQALIRRVAAHLDSRRLITTELYVIPPVYRPIVVSAGVVVRKGYQIDAVRRWVELILRQFLAPVPPFGPDGLGWPLGRTVRRAELEAVAVQVEGVEYLEGLLLASVNATTSNTVTAGDLGPTVGQIDLCSWQVPHLTHLTVVGGPPLAPGSSYPVAPGSLPVDVVLAPLPREVC